MRLDTILHISVYYFYIPFTSMFTKIRAYFNFK